MCEPSKFSTQSQKPTSYLRSPGQYSCQYVDLVNLIVNGKLCERRNGNWERSLFCFACTSAYLNINHYPHKIWLLYENDLLSFTVSLSRWYNDAVCQVLYPILTHWVAKFEVASSVPVCCNTVAFKVTFFPAQHKKVRIRKKLYM